MYHHQLHRHGRWSRRTTLGHGRQRLKERTRSFETSFSQEAELVPGATRPARVQPTQGTF